MRRQIERVTLGALALMALSTTALAQSNLTAKANPVEPRSSSALVESDRSRDGLIGPVRRVRTEIAKLSNESGRLVESKHAILEIVAYDIKGAKVENQYFPVAGANLTGKEVYKYDDKGNISEMTLVNDDGSLLGKEVYKYEFDFAGNWNRMTTSVAVIEAGRMSFEPTEITYRSIMYYLDEKMMRMAQPGAPTASSTPASNTVADSGSKIPTVVTPTVNNSSTSNRKVSAVPTSTVAPDKLNLGSTEVPNARSSAGVQTSMIQVDSEPPPPPAPRPILKPISGGVLNGTAINLPAPIYPDSAKRFRVSGIVSVDVVVDETGKVISASAASGPGPLKEVSVQAALRARFSPTKLSGQPVKVSGVINYKFSLTQ